MKKWAYYNEFDPFAAAWLRELIKAGHIAPGEVDERSIEDVHPEDLKNYAQVHLFGGIGVWSLALRNVGFPDDARIWTGSCPCQPFSAAGKGGGFDDERHLWPAFYHLILNCEPERVVGEQVASLDGLAWLDTVQTDMEIADYAFGAVDTCAAGFGAPHIRQRLYWMAHAAGDGGGTGLCDSEPTGQRRDILTNGKRLGRLGDAFDQPREWFAGSVSGTEKAQHGTWLDLNGGLPVGPEYASPSMGRLAHASVAGLEGRDARPMGRQCTPVKRGGGGEFAYQPGTGPTNGQWGDADWLFCRDGKWWPVEPGTFPLAHGAPARVGRLRGYGNAINVAQAEGFLRAALT